jgi:hypothetical protein
LNRNGVQAGAEVRASARLRRWQAVEKPSRGRTSAIGYRCSGRRRDTDMLKYERHLMVVLILAAIVLAAAIVAVIFDIPFPFLTE